MKKLVALTIFSVLILTACAAPDQGEAVSNRDTADTTTVNETTEKVTTEGAAEEVTTADPKEEIYNREDAFGFAYEVADGTFAHKERFCVKVSLTNQMDCAYEWVGSSSTFLASVYLVSAETPEYKIHHEDIPMSDDISYNKVAVGEAHPTHYYFTIPADAPSGTYHLVCHFRRSTQTFEGAFELK